MKKSKSDNQKMKNRRSNVWEDFILDYKNSVAVCKHCGIKLKFHGGTSTMKRHIQSRHSEICESLQPIILLSDNQSIEFFPPFSGQGIHSPKFHTPQSIIASNSHVFSPAVLENAIQIYTPVGMRSNVWKVFRLSTDPKRKNQALCSLCGTWIAYIASTTSNLRKHWTSRHKELGDLSSFPLCSPTRIHQSNEHDSTEPDGKTKEIEEIKKQEIEEVEEVEEVKQVKVAPEIIEIKDNSEIANDKIVDATSKEMDERKDNYTELNQNEETCGIQSRNRDPGEEDDNYNEKLNDHENQRTIHSSIHLTQQENRQVTNTNTFNVLECSSISADFADHSNTIHELDEPNSIQNSPLPAIGVFSTQMNSIPFSNMIESNQSHTLNPAPPISPIQTESQTTKNKGIQPKMTRVSNVSIRTNKAILKFCIDQLIPPPLLKCSAMDSILSSLYSKYKVPDPPIIEAMIESEYKDVHAKVSQAILHTLFMEGSTISLTVASSHTNLNHSPIVTFTGHFIDSLFRPKTILLCTSQKTQKESNSTMESTQNCLTSDTWSSCQNALVSMGIRDPLSSVSSIVCREISSSSSSNVVPISKLLPCVRTSIETAIEEAILQQPQVFTLLVKLGMCDSHGLTRYWDIIYEEFESLLSQRARIIQANGTVDDERVKVHSTDLSVSLDSSDWVLIAHTLLVFLPLYHGAMILHATSKSHQSQSLNEISLPLSIHNQTENPKPVSFTPTSSIMDSTPIMNSMNQQSRAEQAPNFEAFTQPQPSLCDSFPTPYSAVLPIMRKMCDGLADEAEVTLPQILSCPENATLIMSECIIMQENAQQSSIDPSILANHVVGESVQERNALSSSPSISECVGTLHPSDDQHNETHSMPNFSLHPSVNTISSRVLILPAQEMRKQLHQSLKTQWKNTPHHAALLASMLDPRFKHLEFLSSVEKELAWHALRAEVDAIFASNAAYSMANILPSQNGPLSQQVSMATASTPTVSGEMVSTLINPMATSNIVTSDQIMTSESTQNEQLSIPAQTLDQNTNYPISAQNMSSEINSSNRGLTSTTLNQSFEHQPNLFMNPPHSSCVTDSLLRDIPVLNDFNCSTTNSSQLPSGHFSIPLDCQQEHSNKRRKISENSFLGVEPRYETPMASTWTPWVPKNSREMGLVDSLEQEWRQYKLETPLDPDLDPYTWWFNHREIYPLLSKLSRTFLAIPATSTASIEASHICQAASQMQMNAMLLNSLSTPSLNRNCDYTSKMAFVPCHRLFQSDPGDVLRMIGTQMRSIPVQTYSLYEVLSQLIFIRSNKCIQEQERFLSSNSQTIYSNMNAQANSNSLFYRF